MKTTEFLERRAFNAGWTQGRYSVLSAEMPPGDLTSRDQSWEQYRAQPVQLELPLEAPDED